MFKFFLFIFLTTIAVNDATDNRIVGGRPAIEGEFPYQVSVRRSYNGQHFCGGSLITPKHVLTAAHCMFYIWGGILPPLVVSVVAGQLNLTITPDTIFRNASKIVVHPEFNKDDMNNDIAIIELTEEFPIDTNPLISTIDMREHEIQQSDCIVSGWGVEKHTWENVSEILLAAEINIINRTQCDEMYGKGTIKSGMMCAGIESGERDACQGDSGGPLLCGGLLTGVVSTGSGCADPKYPGIYANVPELLPWIKNNSEEIKITTVVPKLTTKSVTTNPPSTTEVYNELTTVHANLKRNSGTFVYLNYLLLFMYNLFSLIRMIF